MKYTIRNAELKDLPRLADHNQAMARETEDRELSREVLEAGLQEVLTHPEKGFYLVMEHEGEVVANLMVTIEWSDWRNAPMWWFQSVYVRPEHRGKGLFGQMYHEVMFQARAAGVKELRLYVEKTNTRAQRVYEKLGMEESHYLMYEVPVE